MTMEAEAMERAGGPRHDEHVARPSVAVVIPAHRPSAAFTSCMEAVRALDPAPDELIVVVDGGDERIVATARAAGARVVLQRPQAGPAVARNTGAARATSDVVLFLDSDVMPAADVVARVADEFIEQPDVAALIGSYDDEPPPYNCPSLYMNLRHHFVHQRARHEGSTFWGACGAMRRDVFEQLGGFDEDYVAPSIEDIELGYRLKASGHRVRVRVVKDLHVKHLKRWDAGLVLKTDLVFRALPWSALILRSRRLENDLNVSVAERVKSALTLGALVAAVAALFWPARSWRRPSRWAPSWPPMVRSWGCWPGGAGSASCCGEGRGTSATTSTRWSRSRSRRCDTWCSARSRRSSRGRGVRAAGRRSNHHRT